MHELLQDKGLVEVAEDKIFVTDLKGPLEEGWQTKVASFVAGSQAEGASSGRD